jgi:predicted Fe-Mo cluster-binding NifX family protein
MVIEIGCWKWFNTVLKNAGIEATDKNKEKIDKVIHQYISQQASYGRCSPEWGKARKQIQENEEMKKELIGKLKALV